MTPLYPSKNGHPGAITFLASLHRSTTDREGEVTLTLKVPASEALVVTQAFLLLREVPLAVTLSLEGEANPQPDRSHHPR